MEDYRDMSKIWQDEDDEEMLKNIKSPTPVHFKGKTYYLLPESVSIRSIRGSSDSEFSIVVFN